MRVSTGTVRRRKHKKILAATKGYRMSKSKLYKVAHEAYMHAGQYSYAHRRRKHSDMKKIWIKRINAAVSKYDIKYSVFMKQLSDAKIELNKKMLSELALNEPTIFEKIVKSV